MMRQSLYLMIVLFCASSVYGFTPEYFKRILDDPPPRIEQIAETPTIPLVKNGKAVFEIVLPAKPSEIQKYTATEFQRCVKAATSSEVPIVSSPSNGKVSIFLGEQKATIDAGIDPEKLPRDGFMIVAKGQKIYIAGIDDSRGKVKTRGFGPFYERGTFNGVYTFLERFFGVRFYFPGEIGTVIPKVKDLILPEMTILDRPDYPRRRMIAGSAAAWFPELDRSMETPFMMSLRLETFYVPVCHSLERLKFADRFGETHPEYIGMDSNGKRYVDKGSPYYGNICMSDPGLRDELYKDAVAYLTGKNSTDRGLKHWDPSVVQPGFFNIMPKDWFRDCVCPRCRDFYSKHPKADLVWDLTVDIAQRLIDNNISGYVPVLVYGHYTALTKVKFPKNILVMVSARGPWAEMTPSRDAFDKRLEQWREKVGRKPWTWSAVYKYGGLELPNVPPTTPKTIASYFCREKDRICGTFMESETDHWLFSYLNYYFMAKSCWYNDLDWESALKEHHQLMFGAGAGPMEKFFDRIEEIWMKDITGRIVETPTGSQAIPPSSYELWEKLYSPDQMKQFDSWFAEALKLAENDPEATKRIRYFDKYFLGQIKKGREDYAKKKRGVADWTYAVRPLENGESISIDGALNEKAWKKTKDAYLLPFLSEVADVHTKFKIHRDKRNLYIGVQCDEPDPGALLTASTTHDDPRLWMDSVVEFFLNPSGDKVNYYHFIINSNGVYYDASAQRLGASSSYDPSWESRISLKTGKNPKGWCIEARIPLSELRGLEPNKFLANIGRHRALRMKAKTPLYSWSPYIKGFHDLENFGTIRFQDLKEEGMDPDNLLKNSDFTVPQNKWNFGGWVTNKADYEKGFLAYDTKVFRSGGQSLRITNDGKGRQLVTQFLPQLKSNTTYLLTFDMKMEDVKVCGKPGGVNLNFGIPENFFYPDNSYFGTMPWTSQGFTFKTGTLKKGGSFMRLIFFQGTGTVWFDNLRLTEVKSKD